MQLLPLPSGRLPGDEAKAAAAIAAAAGGKKDAKKDAKDKDKGGKPKTALLEHTPGDHPASASAAADADPNRDPLTALYDESELQDFTRENTTMANGGGANGADHADVSSSLWTRADLARTVYFSGYVGVFGWAAAAGELGRGLACLWVGCIVHVKLVISKEYGV